jgi:hypothetical protein
MLSREKLKMNALRQHGDGDLRFQHCQSLTDALSRASAKREPKEAMTLRAIFRRKPLRIEGFRPFPYFRVPMQ